MNPAEKKVSYQVSNTYSTLNEFTNRTKNVWMVFHGIGYLSRYFLKYFKHLNSEENYIVAPQAQSKYYLSNEYRHVGASWLTKENTETEIGNTLAYLDEVYEAENLIKAPNLILLGFSQGVSVATRWVARNKIKCSKFILHSGGLPTDLQPEDFQFLNNTEVALIYGTKDEFLNEKRLLSEKSRANKLFGKNLKIYPFEGGHELKIEILSKFV